MNTREVGKLGENIAKSFLKKEGYKIIEENFWCRYGEIDIIAKEEEYIVFIEVKLTTNNSFINPQEKVDYTKRKHLIKVARYYLSKHQKEFNFRFDVVAICNYKHNREVNLIRNAFFI